ncbi:zinc finger protein GAI-ASSOCIATED FACTOR 1-like [Mercurialis annua]|uniref:zinc finger protein GAI-ASSOCIATED FACTOR 1-like n=1 Tax=Mercurialis annua TaxID=3986 RepID=UPI00215EA9A2|nr:zinc finger protein GAI-ASSOCIATED FACTOR 1-like [Mercurialis annua]
MSNNRGENGSLSSAVGEEVEEQQLNHHFSATHKRKRNLPGNPDPSAEVIALSPNTLVAKNRFICEICKKGFQRDQNLQLHRRGHNLPWKLKQRTSDEIKKRVYICPEPSCVHHNPARALGDLTGIKKHFSRKHGEKKWKCDKCLKKYAVQSDWKAHFKTCGTKEYKCDCGIIFSRRDSFITHRAFCDALTEENNKQNQELLTPNLIPIPIIKNTTHEHQTPLISNFNHLPTSQTMFNSSATLLGTSLISNSSSSSSSSLQLTANSLPLMFEGSASHVANASASMSATALLQKAAQMGATSSCNNNLMSFSATTMAPSTFDHQQTGSNDGYVNQFFNANGVSMFNNNNEEHEIFKNIEEQESCRFFHGENDKQNGGLSSLNGEVMTVDFLGVGGSRKRNISELQTALEKSMWDV